MDSSRKHCRARHKCFSERNFVAVRFNDTISICEHKVPKKWEQKDKVITQKPEFFKSLRLFMEFQFADCLTHICAYLCSILYPGVTLVNALCIQLPLTSSFFYTCHLGLVSSFHHRVIFVPLSLSLSVCPSYYICNQEKHCVTLPYLTDPSLFTASLPAFFHLSFKAIISAV